MTREEEIQYAAEIYSFCVDATNDEDLYNSTELEAFKDGAEWADSHPVKKHAVTINAWVARDENELISLYKEKPSKSGDFYVGGFCALLHEEDFPKVTFENSPKKVKVTIELEEEE